MSYIFKVAYARGVQHALVNTGAIRKYANEGDADMAAEMAAAEMAEDLEPVAEEVPAGDTAAVAAKLVELSNAAEETAAAAQEQADVAGEAAAAVAAIKESSDVTGATDTDNSILSAGGVTAEGAAEAGKRPSEYARNTPAPQAPNAQQGVQAPHPGAPTNIDVTKAAQVNLDGRTAAAILRKLAEGSDYDELPSSDSGPNSVGDSPTAEGQMDASNRPAGEANNPPPVSEPVAQVGVEAPHPESPGDAGPLEGKVASAYDLLFNKTASEVLPYLPNAMAEQHKVAAIRTMIGMTGPERIDYLLRIKQAEEQAELEDDLSAKEEKEVREIVKEESKEEEAKEAAMILRRLGFGA